MSITAGLLNNSIDYIYSTTKNAYGKLVTTTVYHDVQCRWEEGTLKDLSNVAEALDYDIRVYLSPEYNTILESYVIEKDSLKYKIVKIRKPRDLAGEIDHVVLYLK